MQRDTPKFGVLAVIAVLAGISALMISRSDRWSGSSERTASAYDLRLDDLIEIDPELIGFQLDHSVNLKLDRPRGICVGIDDRLIVIGDSQLQQYDASGTFINASRFNSEPRAVGTGSTRHHTPGRMYVGLDHQIALVDSNGQIAESWKVPGDAPEITSIAVGTDLIWVADAANRLVMGYDRDGKITDRVGVPKPDRDTPGFVVPSACFDVAVDDENLLHVVNPGRLRVEAYSGSRLESFWGEPSPRIDGFFGCCNPSHLSMMPSGEFVTSEKGIPRIKLYSPQGDFECVVAGPFELGLRKSEIGDPRSSIEQAVYDVATDQHGRVLVLDPKRKRVLYYKRTRPSTQELNSKEKAS